MPAFLAGKSAGILWHHTDSDLYENYPLQNSIACARLLSPVVPWQRVLWPNCRLRVQMSRDVRNLSQFSTARTGFQPD